MSTGINWPTIGGTSYNIPATGELNWQALSSFLIALGNSAQSVLNTKWPVRIGTTSPITVATPTDMVIVTDLITPGAVAVTLPAGITGQIFVVVDGKGDAGTNHITITADGSELINGASTYVINQDRAGIMFGFNGVSWTVLAEFNNISAGTIPRSKIAPGTPNQVVINDGSGNLSSEAALAKVRGGTGADNSAVAFPSTGVIVTEDGSETLTNKIIDGDDNTIQDLAITALKTVIGQANKFFSFNGSGAPIATKAVPTGDVLGTTDAQVVSNKSLLDSTTLILDSIDQTKAFQFDAANVTAGQTRTFQVPDGNTTLLGTDFQATVTNKDIDGGTASNSHRVTIPSATKATLDGLTRKSGTIVYATDTKLTYMDNGSVLVPIGSGGTGVKNYVLNPNDVTQGWAVSGAGVAIATTTTTANLPDNVTQTTAISITRASGSDYARYRFTLDQADYNKLLQIVWDQLYTGTAGDYAVQIWSNTASNYGGTYTQIATPVTNIPATTGSFNTTFSSPASGNQYMELRIVGVAGTTALYLNNVTVTPGQLVQGAAVSGSVTYTPTIVGCASSDIKFQWQRVGNVMNVWGRFGVGTPNGSTATLSIPSGYTIDVSNMTGSQVQGMWYNNDSSGAATIKMGTVIIPSTATGTIVNFGFGSTVSASSSFTALTGSSLFNSGNVMEVNFFIPIAEWAGNGSVNLGQGAQVEYAASTTGTWDAAAAAANTVYGPGGAPIPGSLTTGRLKVVRFQYPVQAGDRVVLQYLVGGIWVDASESAQNYSAQNVFEYGATIQAIANSTDVTVSFRQYSISGSSYAASSGAINWGTGGTGLATAWRLVKATPSAPVGYGLASSTASGLITKFSEGTYVFTPTSQTNLDAVLGSTTANYSQVGNTVTVWGSITVDINAASAATSFEVALPIASNLSNAYDIAGVMTGNESNTGQRTWQILKGTTATTSAKFQIGQATGTGAVAYNYSFVYRIN